AGLVMVGGGARALTACSQDAPAPRLFGSADVAIVGGGLAGLVCAYRLRQHGVHADIYEASSGLGGRVQSDRSTFPDGMHVEIGGELIDTSHSTMRGLANELGI